MKEKRNLLIGMLLGVLFSWALVSFSLPFIVKKYSFLLGFIACLLLAAIALILYLVWSRDAFAMHLMGRGSSTKNEVSIQRGNVLLRVLLIVFILLGVLVSSFLITNQYNLSKKQLEFQKKEAQHRAELLDSHRNSSLVYLMSNILNKIDEELKNNPTRVLSDETIARIAALSFSFNSYKQLDGGQLSEKKLSPERVQLLMALSNMNLDSLTFHKIKSKTTFSEADLRGVNLKKADLSHIDLRGADLSNADLRGIYLSGANLRASNLSYTELKNSNLNGADLRRAKLRWADLMGSNVKNVNFQGADLTNCKLNRVDFNGADLKWTKLNEVFLNNANLAGVELSGAEIKKANLNDCNLSNSNLRWVQLHETNLNRANLTKADLSGANLSAADLNQANLSEATLYKAVVNEENWFELISDWQVIGVNELAKKYKMVKDEFGEANYRFINI